MQRIFASGGWAYGPPDGPQLDLLPIPDTVRPANPLTALRNALRESPAHWMTVRDMPSPTLPRDWTGIYGVTARVAVRLTYPRALSPTLALRQIEEHEQADGTAPPSDLCAALLVALRGVERRLPLDRIGMAALLAADNLPPHADRSEWPKALGGKDVESIVRRHCRPGHPPTSFPPLRPLDLARVAIEVGRQLWEPAWRTLDAATWIKALGAEIMAAGGEPQDIARRAWLAMLAAVELLLQSDPAVHIGGVRLSVPDDLPTLQTAWLSAQTMAAQGSGAEVIRALIPDGRMPGPIHPALYQNVAVDRGLLRGLSASLLREADERAAYVVTGVFRLDLPPELPLAAAGVKALAVVAEPEGLWLRLCAPAPTGPILRWDPAAVTDDRLTGMSDWFYAVLAALWHDLRVGGDSAVVERASGRGTPPAPRLSTAGPPPAGRTTVRYLPPVRLTGRREWGTPGEREYVARRAHGVRGHLRRLHPGWSRSNEARRLADSFGLLLPDGFTFVRPFVRGGGAGDAPAEVVIRARGLATLISLTQEQ